METSILVSKILSSIYLSFAFGLLFSGKYYKDEIPKLVDNSAYLLLGGLLAIVFGFLILEFHNYWNSDWTVVITIIGWIALVKGIILIVFPNIFANCKNNILKAENLRKYIMPLMFIMGIFFGYFGFIK